MSSSQQTADILRIGDQIHQEVVHAAQESAPFEQVAADDDHQRPIAGFSQLQCPGSQSFPEAILLDVIPGAVRKGSPEDLSPRVVQIVEGGRITIHIREVDLIKEGPARRHLRDRGAVLGLGNPGAVFS